MNTSGSCPEMVLIYDIRKDKARRERLFGRAPESLEAYLQHKVPTEFVEGEIVDVFFDPYKGERFFKLGERGKFSSRELLGDESWYAIGRVARAENATFAMPDPVGRMTIITRIWIGQTRAGYYPDLSSKRPRTE